MLEKMDDFFTARIDGYDRHMRDTIEGADTFYKFTASLLPKNKDIGWFDLIFKKIAVTRRDDDERVVHDNKGHG